MQVESQSVMPKQCHQLGHRAQLRPAARAARVLSTTSSSQLLVPLALLGASLHQL